MLLTLSCLTRTAVACVSPGGAFVSLYAPNDRGRRSSPQPQRAEIEPSMKPRPINLLLVALLLGSLAQLVAAESKPNVLLILSDDHSYPHVGCYGNTDIMTPNLDRFAAEGASIGPM
jgi:hypothetical protein